MIYPSVYKYNAPYRGSKESKEVNKLFTSIIYDLSVAYDELESQASKVPANLKFCVSADVLAEVKFPTSGSINGSDYTYRGIDASSGINQSINSIQARVNQILKNL